MLAASADLMAAEDPPVKMPSPAMVNSSSSRRLSLEGLLYSLYEGPPISTDRHLSPDWTTDYSAMSDGSNLSVFPRQSKCFTADKLAQLDEPELKRIYNEMQAEAQSANVELMKALKRRDQQLVRARVKCNHITAILQAFSPKRSVDTKLQFSLDPPSTECGYEQWLNAMKAVSRLPDGIPNHFRKKLWVTLANHHIESLEIDWDHVQKTAFNDRLNPDDDKLGMQIIKDLHRTGWSGLTREPERIQLKRVLLAYARYNKDIGYCQGFNVIAAIVMELTDYREENALKILIFLIEHVLPSGYFDQSLRALSVDMAVLRDLLHQRLPKMAMHLEQLQKNSESEYEPPLTNVFSMQWFLTLFATCLPKTCVYRVWDALMLEGSEILLRVSLAIWAKISRSVKRTKSADGFYDLMGISCQHLMQMRPDESNELMQVIYAMAEFPYPGLSELRERYTWNIQPFSQTFKVLRQQVSSILNSDNDDTGSDTDASPTTCAMAILPGSEKVCGSDRVRDVSALQKQYKLIKKRQKQAAVILQTAYEANRSRLTPNSAKNYYGNSSRFLFKKPSPVQSPLAFNHLYVNKDAKGSDQTYMAISGCSVPVSSKIVQPSAKVLKKSRTPLDKKQQAENDTYSDTRGRRGSTGRKWPSKSENSDEPQSSRPTNATLSVISDTNTLTSYQSLVIEDENENGIQMSDRLKKENKKTIERWHSEDFLLLAGRQKSLRKELATKNAIYDKDGDRKWSSTTDLLASVFGKNGIGAALEQNSSDSMSPTSNCTDDIPVLNLTKASNGANKMPIYDTGDYSVENKVVSKLEYSQPSNDFDDCLWTVRKKEAKAFMSKSKAIVNSLANRPVTKPAFNPFPTRHRTSLIETEKKIGLWS